MSEKKIAIMQPYFLPYLGYFQLMNAVDEFVIYDNIEFTKKGWIHRNRILVNGKPDYISLPLKSDSDYLNVNQRVLSVEFERERLKTLGKIQGTYRKAPYFKEAFDLMKDILYCPEDNLFAFVHNSIILIKSYLDIKSKLTISSSVEINHNLKSEEKVIAICKALQAREYINPEGGLELYKSERFDRNDLKLHFHKFDPVPYSQNAETFVSHLSIIDVLMHCGKDSVKEKINNEYIII